jgi:hypothetical protein
VYAVAVDDELEELLLLLVLVLLLLLLAMLLLVLLLLLLPPPPPPQDADTIATRVTPPMRANILGSVRYSGRSRRPAILTSACRNSLR